MIPSPVRKNFYAFSIASGRKMEAFAITYLGYFIDQCTGPVQQNLAHESQTTAIKVMVTIAEKDCGWSALLQGQ